MKKISSLTRCIFLYRSQGGRKSSQLILMYNTLLLSIATQANK